MNEMFGSNVGGGNQGVKVKVQAFGRFLSAMVMPNI